MFLFYLCIYSISRDPESSVLVRLHCSFLVCEFIIELLLDDLLFFLGLVLFEILFDQNLMEVIR
jgi:hypothetical protein